MTDRYNALTVVLERDIREDDAEPLIEAIRMLRGVASVQPHVADPGSFMAKSRARRDLREKLWSILREPELS